MTSELKSNLRLSRRAIRILLAIGIVGLAGLYLGYRVFIRPMFFIDFDPMRFVAEDWKQSEADYSWDSVRLRMADDLLLKYPLVGLTKQEVIDLLGDPDDDEYFRGYELVYFLGAERSPISIDGEWLVVDLDENNIATAAKLVND